MAAINTTKEKILQVSLDLFSQRGFSAVSIRDICKQVQIKESSVYYHFENKQAILNELLARYEKTANRLMGRLETALAKDPVCFDGNMYGKISDTFFEEFLMDDFCNQVMRLLLIEQSGNDGIRAIYDRWMFEKPLGFQSKIFSILMESGVIPKTDSDYLAIQYYAPIYLYTQRWLLSGELTEARKELFRKAAYRHARYFLSRP